MSDFFCLPILINEQKIYTDLQVCLKTKWNEHFNTNDYSGSWTAIALRSQSGNSQDIFAHDSELPFRNTSLMQECHYFQEILDKMPFEKETVRLLRLQPGSVIKEHRDIGLAYHFGCFRLHIPIVTDALVEFIVGGKNIPMKKGECWYANFDLPHCVNNESEQERIHLVIDGKRNTWTDELFALAGYNFEEEKNKDDYSIETKIQMIEHLRLMKTEAADNEIKKLELEINKTLDSNKHED